MRKCEQCGVEIGRKWAQFCDPCRAERARKNSARTAERKRTQHANRIKTPSEARAAQVRKINTAEAEIYRKCIPVIVAAYQRANEYDRAKIAALNPGLSFGAA